MKKADRNILRDLAKKYLEICNAEVQIQRRNHWRAQNSLKPAPILIYVRAFAWQEMPESRCLCEDAFYRHYEDFFRNMLFRSTFEDDFIFEPWLTVDAACATHPEGIWGVKMGWIGGDDPRGAKQIDPPIKSPEDIERLVKPRHEIDEKATAEKTARLADAIGDLITINIDRAPIFRVWNADISTRLGHLRGIEQMMWDMMDRPQWLHELLRFMRDGILQVQEQAEKAGDWALCDHQNQAMPYSEELDDPAPNSPPVSRNRLWNFCASQETTLVGPDLFDEFMLQYQIPIMEKFALTAYGCCEDLTRKIGLLRKVPNLRRIAIAPTADVAKCAEQIGTDYVLSYRPSPSDMVGYDFDPRRIRSILKRDLEACRGCHVDITLKDVETVQGDPTRVRKWVQIVRSVIYEMQILS
ncbi:hypothetical protein JXJ21_14475 [candidate division KSB1 bacterium]|nr:hypothetical protein [candidate division KSB1 bacterium]